MTDAGVDPGVQRAGAAFAARREELGISQRELARKKILSAANLIAFEKGRAWPREKTRARLEQVAQWPPGQLARIYEGRKTLRKHAIAPVEPHSDASGVVSTMVTMAIAQMRAVADNLPEPSDPTFSDKAAAVLADLRTMEATLVRAVRITRGAPEVISALKTVRERYGQLMALAASTPQATLGQRLYAARVRSALSVADVAAAVDVTPESVEALEAEQFVTDENTRRLAAFISDLEGQ